MHRVSDFEAHFLKKLHQNENQQNREQLEALLQMASIRLENYIQVVRALHAKEKIEK